MNLPLAKSPAAITPRLELRDLCIDMNERRARLRVVDQVNLSLFPGKTCALVGESGCGKSVTALAMMNLLPSPPFFPPTGTMLIDGVPYSLQAARGHQRLAMVFQNPMTSLNPLLTIGTHLIQTALVHRTHDPQEAHELAVATLKDVHMQAPRERMEDYPHQLSGGMRQRVLIALALISSPSVLIGDEPTTALDLTVKRQVMELLEEIKRTKQLAMLLISHDISLVEDYADEVCVMYLSEQVECASKKELLQAPRHPYTQGLLASQPRFGDTSSVLTPIPGMVPSLSQKPQGCYFAPRCSYATKECQSKRITLTPKETAPGGQNEQVGASKHLVRCVHHEKIALEKKSALQQQQ